MHSLVFNLVKPLILSAMVIPALIALGASIPASVVFGAIVLVFGSLHVANRFVYGLTALVVIAAACTLLVPVSTINGLATDAGGLIQDIVGKGE